MGGHKESVQRLFKDLRADNEGMAKELLRLEKVNKELREKVIRLKNKSKEIQGTNKRLQEALTSVAERTMTIHNTT